MIFGRLDIIVKLPFLKSSKWPRVAPPMEEKTVGGSLEDKLDDHLAGELMAACAEKNVKRFREALEALVLNCFEEETDAA